MNPARKNPESFADVAPLWEHIYALLTASSLCFAYHCTAQPIPALSVMLVATSHCRQVTAGDPGDDDWSDDDDEDIYVDEFTYEVTAVPRHRSGP